MIPIPSADIRQAVRSALREDLALGDATTAALFSGPCPARGLIVARQTLVAAGIAAAHEVFRSLDPSLKIVRAVKEGTKLATGDVLLAIEGDGRSLLMGERIALNFLQHLSGIATLTARFCRAVRGYPVRILDTRKTVPGSRSLEKWAVRLGGGSNHRHSLGDGVLIKDNHLALLRARGLNVADACRLARERCPHGLRIIVEAESLEQIREALDGGADVILLDNMAPATVRRAVDTIKGRALVEVSGGITLENVREMAEAGANFISIGALTHSAPAADLSMDILPLGNRRRTA
ncbi:MAG: carboxylating nicotinate-nucleotide diphosphorylase [Nitrospirota bacterium]